MRNRVYVYCHRPSSSANILKRKLRTLGIRVKRLYGVRPPVIKGGVCINWGCSDVRFLNHFGGILNNADKVAVAISKIKSLTKLQEAKIPTVRITEDREEAKKWLRKNYRVLERIDGLSNGRGIRLFHPDNVNNNLDFYARVFPKTHEFRVHVVDGLAIDMVEKKAKTGADENRVIRTHENGWVYAHEGLSLHDQRDIDSLCALAVSTIKTLELDFGAVDILCILDDKNPRRLQKSVVCEINTSPGLENTRTINAYATNIARMIQQGARV